MLLKITKFDFVIVSPNSKIESLNRWFDCRCTLLRLNSRLDFTW